MQPRKRIAALSGLTALVLTALLTGCSTGTSAAPDAAATTSVATTTETSATTEAAPSAEATSTPSEAATEAPTAAANVVEWRVPDDVAAATFVNGSVFYPEAPDAFEVGKADGTETTAFLRIPLGTDFFSGEVQEAKLFLKPVSAEIPTALKVGTVGQSWTAAYTDTTNEPGLLPDAAAITEVPVTPEADGWISLDVTKQVQAWLSGEVRNNGFVFSGVAGQPIVDFATTEPDTPYFEVAGTVGDRPTDQGLFGFTQQPEGDIWAADDSGNCLSFALRDNNSILFDDLGMNYDEINRIFTESGEDGVAEYVAQHVEGYVDAHKDALQISGFRRLDSYDSPIDPATEYRIALRVGASQPGGLGMSEQGGFDYHLWAQLADGRWAQKFPQDYSEIIPGTSAERSPDQNYWDSGRQFGSPKTQDFYQSKIIYFAVTKATPDFTAHKTV